MKQTLLFTLVLAAAAQAQSVLYRAGVIHTVSGESILNGEMLVNGSRIVAVGKAISCRGSWPAATISAKWDKLPLTPGCSTGWHPASSNRAGRSNRCTV